VTTTKLNHLLEWDENNDARLTLCKPLAHALKRAIAAQFTKQQLKLDWLDDPFEQLRVTASLKRHVVAVAMSALLTTDVASTMTSAAPSSSSSSVAVSKDFFVYMQARLEAP